jgi:D-cysteine desulfhydrase
MIPLFEAFPQLKNRLPYTGLCELPTPIHKLAGIARETGVEQLYIKQDGLTAQPFGGNKVRKLEFLLGEALDRGAREVLTFGFAGSNHALATAVHGQRLGLRCISMLLSQENALYVRRNLLMSLQAGAELHYYKTKRALVLGTGYQLFRHLIKTGKKPVVILPGGSSPVGVTGYVNAALELKRQLEKENTAEPDYIYITLGSAGTFVGLTIGLKALGIESRVIPVRVIDHSMLNKSRVLGLFSRTVTFLRSKDPSFPEVKLSEDELDIRDEYLGDGYARFTGKGMEAVRMMADLEDIRLDGTYTGKTFAALLDDARCGKLKNRTVLFWNTLNAYDLTTEIEGADYHRLPKPFHRYFEEDVQVLDD